MNEIANKSANYARIAQYASNVAQYTLNEFNTIYLGAKATAPTLDNDGNPLIVGALYFNTVTDIMYSWDGTSWISAIVGANTATTDTNQTITGVKTFTQPIVGNLTGNVTGNLTGNVTGNVTGNSTTATTLATARTFDLSGDVTGVAQSFNGSANIVIPSTIANNAVITSKIQNLAVTAAKLGTNEQKQICKAWVNFDGTTSPGTIRSSYNVSSVTKNGTGNYTVNFTTAMNDANYTTVGTCNNFSTILGAPYVSSQTINSIQISTGSTSPALFDVSTASVQVFGN
jgi:hypothetical protein